MDVKLLTSKIINNPGKVFRKGKRILDHSAEDIYRFIFKNGSDFSYINKKELRIIGLRRTGNHGIAGWIKAQENGKVEHLNNLEVRCNPYRYKYEKIIDFYPKHTKWAIKHYQPLAQGNFVQIDCLICGYEDRNLASITDPIFERLHDVYLGKSNKRFDIIIIRDPFNLFASRLKSNMINVKSKNFTAIDLWIQYAREFLHETNYLNNNKICINYNRWFTDLVYRKELANQLELEFTDEGFSRVTGLGGGSSFDGQTMDRAASKMAVLDRWKNFVDNPDYRKIFQNQLLITYSKKIFGDIPGTEILH